VGDGLIPEKILITGATGFIGSRLCEILTLRYKWPYRAMTRRLTRAARVARLNAELVTGDLNDRSSILSALDGCNAVLHLAHSDDRAAPRETRNLLAACMERGIERFVHVSSMSVHGPSPTARCATEDTATISRYDDPYCNSKAQAEEIVQAAVAKHAFPAAILRPTLVYGPYSGFVTSIVNEARSGTVSLIDGGRWVCNAVYVDDVCDAICLAVQRDEAIGRPCFINGSDDLTWKDFVMTFANMVVPPPDVFSISSTEAREYLRSRQPTLRKNLELFGKLAVSPDLHKLLATVPAIGTAIVATKRFTRRHASDEWVMKMKRPRPHAAQPGARMPNAGRLIRETCPVRLSNHRARKLLGWEPAHDFTRGAARTKSWLEFAHHLSTD
jgi:nucleoside-diphosphate-sugar epimerase